MKILTGEGMRNRITSVAAFYKISYRICAAILLGPTLQGTYSGRQNIYGYFHGIFSRNRLYLYIPRGYSFRSERNRQGPKREITPPSQFKKKKKFFFKIIFHFTPWINPLLPSPTQWVKSVEKKSPFLVTQTFQKFANSITTKATKKNKATWRLQQQIQPLLVSNTHQLLKLISYHL